MLQQAMTQSSTRQTRENSLGWMIQRIAGALNREMTARLGEHDMALIHFSVMMTVLERGGLPQTEIGGIIHAPDYTVSRAIDKLVKQGRVERCAHATSRRAVAVLATDKGRALAPTLHRIVAEINSTLVAPLPSEQDREALKTLLWQIMPQVDRNC